MAWEALRSEEGQDAVEYVGALATVAALVAVVVAIGLPGQVAARVSHSVNCVFSAGRCASQAAPAASAKPARTALAVAPSSGDGGACGLGGHPFIGPVLAGQAQCEILGTNQLCHPQTNVSALAGGGKVTACVPDTGGGTPPPRGSSATKPPTTISPPPLPKAPTPNSPWIVSDPFATQQCPYGYDFHVTLDEKTPWCANSTLDPNPSQLLENPDHNNRFEYPPGLVSAQLECSSTTGCIYPGPDEWQQGIKWVKCGTACTPPEHLPAWAPIIPGDPNSGLQVFPYGVPQAEAFVQAYYTLDHTIDQLDNLQGVAHDTIEDREKQKEASEEALEEVTSPKAELTFAAQDASESSADEGEGLDGVDAP
jgi:hypothetical protein